MRIRFSPVKSHEPGRDLALLKIEEIKVHFNFSTLKSKTILVRREKRRNSDGYERRNNALNNFLVNTNSNLLRGLRIGAVMGISLCTSKENPL